MCASEESKPEELLKLLGLINSLTPEEVRKVADFVSILRTQCTQSSS